MLIVPAVAEATVSVSVNKDDDTLNGDDGADQGFS
jgi:hypothetical protein